MQILIGRGANLKWGSITSSVHPADAIGLGEVASPAGVDGVVEGGLLQGCFLLLLLLRHEGDVGAEGVVGGLGELILGAEVVELAIEPAVRGRVTVLAAEFARGELSHGLDHLHEPLVSLGRYVRLDLLELLELAFEDRGELVGEGIGMFESDLGNPVLVVEVGLGLGLGSGLIDQVVVVDEPVALAQGDDVGDAAKGDVLHPAFVLDGGDRVLDVFDDLLEHGSSIEGGVVEVVTWVHGGSEKW